MERRKRFLIGLSAALITFGSLMAFVGPRHYRHHGRFQHDHHECRQSPHGLKDQGCYENDPGKQEKAPEMPRDSGQ